MDIIIGSGATGLTYASRTVNDYIILERDKEPGGYCKTIKKLGFVWDYSGHFFHFLDKKLEKYLFSDMPSDDILRCLKYTQIFYNGRYIDYPFQKNIHQLPKVEFIDCLYDLFFNPYSTSSSFKEMLYAKFGKGISERFLIPYNEKLYACDLNSLDPNAMGRFFPYAEKEEIIANFKKSSDLYYNSYFTYPRGGAIQYINSLINKIDKNKLFLDEDVLSLDLKRKEVITNKRVLHYDNVISTIPFCKLLKLCNISYDNSAYSWNKVLVFNLGFDKKGKDRTNNWVYFPGKDICFYRVGYYDNIFKDERMSLYVELGFRHEEQFDVDSCLKNVLSDLKKVGIIENHKLISYHHIVMNPAYVHISERSQKDVCEKKELLSQYDVYSIGRYGSWTYCSIEDGMHEAINLANKLQNRL